MSDAHWFWPVLSQTEGASVDRTVRKALISSLKALFVKAAGQIDSDGDRLHALLGEIEVVPIRPAVFGLYTDLVEALFRNDSTALGSLGRQLLDINPSGAGTRIVALTDQDLGAHQAERYARLIDDDPNRPYGIRPLVHRYGEAYVSVSSALTLLDEGVPELAKEIRALVREIVLVSDTKTNEPRSFDGASTFYLWGAVFLNVGDATRLQLAQQIAHEAAHLLLFGLMVGQPVTENDSEERFISPLRQDPRPMEGVVHAAYVLARMSYVLERLLESERLLPAEQREAQELLALHRKRFFDTLPVVMRHARFKPKAQTIFHGAIEYMNRNNAQAIAL